MAVAYDLTPTEARVLNGLLSGLTLTETAAMLGVADTTAKTHLGNIFEKTGVARQAELVRLSAQLVPPTAGPPKGVSGRIV